MKNRHAHALAIVAIVVSATLGTAPVAHAQNESTPIELTFEDMGVGRMLSIDGVDGRNRLTVPVAPGTAPQTLFATAQTPMGLGRGWLDVSSAGLSVTRIELSPNVTSVPFSAPLTGLPVVDNAMTLEFSTALIPEADYCLATREGAGISLVNASVGFTGQPTVPSTISTFLPPVLRSLTVYVPDRPDTDQSAAALALTSSVVHYYGAQPVAVVLRPDGELADAAPDGPFHRSVAISPNTDGSSQLIFPTQPAPPTLFVSGSGGALMDQVRLITSSISALAVATSASIGALSPPPMLSPDSVSLDDLSVGTLTASAPGQVSVVVPVDQTRLGRSARNMSVHLLGSYTPLPDNLDAAITVAVGDKTLAVVPAGSTGRLDHWVDIPSSVAARVTGIDVTLAAASGESDCGRGGSMTLTVDGESSVTSSGSGSPTPSGFASIPQALMPRVAVAMSEQSFANTVRAVGVVTGLQRLSALPLAPQLVSMDDVANGDTSAVVIASDGVVSDSIALPLRGSGSTTFTVAAPPGGRDASVTIDGSTPYASLQVAYDSVRQRTVLVASASSSSASDQLDRELAWLDGDPARWFGLSGDVLFQPANQDPVSLSSAELTASAADASSTAPGTSADTTIRTIIAIGAVALVVAVAIALVILVRTRRRTSRHGATGAP